MRYFRFLLAAFFACAALTACSKQPVPDADAATVALTFRLAGDFQSPTFTRATLTAGTTAMTDLWLFDYDADGALVQQLHQTTDDADFGAPTLALTLGAHDLYFVCSAGSDPVLSTAAHTLSWGTPRDAFWQHLPLTVTAATPSTEAVTLSRVTTRLSATLSDAIADGTATLRLTPAAWYYGIDYLTGAAADLRTAQPFRITIPSSYVGRTDVKVAILGLAPADEFTTDVTLAALDAADAELATVTLTSAPFQRNRSTDYTGALFAPSTADAALTVTLAADWSTPYTATW